MFHRRCIPSSKALHRLEVGQNCAQLRGEGRGKRVGEFYYEGSGVQFYEKHPWGMSHRIYLQSLKGLRRLEVDQNRDQLRGGKSGKRGKNSIPRVVRSNFPKNTPVECPTEHVYQV